MDNENKLMAFWGYDKKPYLLCGEVVSFDKKGNAYIKEYGGYFKPVLILPYSEGLELSKELKNMAERYDEKIKELNRDFSENLRGYIEQFGLAVDKYNRVFQIP